MSLGEIALGSRALPVERRRPRRALRSTAPATRYLGMAAVLLVVNWASTTFWTPSTVFGPYRAVRFSGDRVLGGWVQWDGNWYRGIALNGYSYSPGRVSSVAFFPGYPLAMRAMGHLVGDPVVAGILITIACGLASVVLLHRFAREHCGDATAAIAVVALVVYPYAWYLFGAVYSDALFLAAALGAFLLAEADHPFLAGLCGAVATATRPVGIAVVIGLVVLELTRRRHVGSPQRRRIDLVLVSAGGLVAWCTYLWRTYGDPLLFMKVEGAPGWDEAPGVRTMLKVSWLQHLSHVPADLANRADPQSWFHLTYAAGTIFQAALALAGLALLPRIDRRLGRAYTVYTAIAIGIAVVGSKDFQGLGRYLLAAFPAFVAGADLLVEKVGRRPQRLLAGASAALLVFLTSAYARGHYLA